MEIEMYLTVANDWIINDRTEDAPLAHIKLSNELRELNIEEQLNMMTEIKLVVVEHLRRKANGK